MSTFAEGKYVEAIKTFIDLDVNPAKVVALYPDAVAGRLSMPRSKWIELFGGKASKSDEANVPPGAKVEGASDASAAQTAGAAIAAGFRATVEAVLPALPDGLPGLGNKDDDVKSVSSGTENKQAASTVKDKGKGKEDRQLSS